MPPPTFAKPLLCKTAPSQVWILSVKGRPLSMSRTSTPCLLAFTKKEAAKRFSRGVATTSPSYEQICWNDKAYVTDFYDDDDMTIEERKMRDLVSWASLNGAEVSLVETMTMRKGTIRLSGDIHKTEPTIEERRSHLKRLLSDTL